jgi:hydrogenase-4 component F
MSLLLLLSLPFFTAVLCRLLWHRPHVESVNLVGAGATLVVGLWVASDVILTGQRSALGDLLFVDALSALMIAIIVVVGGCAALYSVSYLRHDVAAGEVSLKHAAWYYPGFHAFMWTMLVTVTVNNLGLLWVAIEATTLASALLVGFYRTRAALEAAWKYLILCTVGITFALFGVLLTYFAAGQVLGEQAASLNWTDLVGVATRLNPELMRLAFAFVVIGFGAKAGFAPLHTWLPDAHSQAPSPVSAVLSGVLLNCALYGILRFQPIAQASVGPAFVGNLLLGFGLLSALIATPFILVQRDLKRLLAYSSVEHTGLVAVAIGIGGPLATYVGLLHLVNHALTKPLLFFAAGDVVQRYGTRRIGKIRGVVTAAPLTGSLLLLGAFAITGLPPSGIFISELGIVMASFGRGQVAVGVLIAVVLAIIFAGFVRHAIGMAFGRPPRTSDHSGVPVSRLIALLPLVVGVLGLGLYVPPLLSATLEQAAAVLMGGGIR